MDLTFALRAFIRTVERGSMTAAARDLGVSQPAISKLLRKLEAHVRARLLERNSRAMTPTAKGLHLYQASSAALSAIDAAIEGTRSDTGGVGGDLRLHGPVCLGESRLHRIVAAFQERHPDVSVRLTLENHSADLVREGFDLALQLGRPNRDDMVCRRVGTIRRILVAAPAYFSAHRPLNGPLDLLDHAVFSTDTALTRSGSLVLCREDAITEVGVRPVLVTNNAQILIEALLLGRGVGTAQVQLVFDDLKAGRLLRVLPDYELKASDLFLTYPSATYLRPVVRAFIDFVVPALRRIEGLS